MWWNIISNREKVKGISFHSPQKCSSLHSPWSGVVKSRHVFLVGVVLVHDSEFPCCCYCCPGANTHWHLQIYADLQEKVANSWRPMWPFPAQAHSQPTTGLKYTKWTKKGGGDRWWDQHYRRMGPGSRGSQSGHSPSIGGRRAAGRWHLWTQSTCTSHATWRGGSSSNH